MAALVGNIADIDGFSFIAVFADYVKGLLHGVVLPKLYKLRGHYGAGGIFGILQNFVYFFAGVRVGIFKNTLYDIGRHFFNNVYGIIKVKFVKNGFQFGVGKALYEHFLRIAFKFDKNIRRNIFWKKAEHHRAVFFRHIVKKKGYIRGIEVVKLLFKLVISLVFNKFLQLFKCFIVFFFKIRHDKRPLSHKTATSYNMPIYSICQGSKALKKQRKHLRRRQTTKYLLHTLANKINHFGRVYSKHPGKFAVKQTLCALHNRLV